MNHTSAVEFSTRSRIHMGLAVRDLKHSLAFYRALFGVEPDKTRPGYARFNVAEPPVNLSLNEIRGETGPNNTVAHFGVQAKFTQAVREAVGRLSRAGIVTRVEEEVTCCYAVQTKVWASDPDGNRWEVYVVLEDAAAQHHSSAGDCCREAAPADAAACC